MDGVFRVWGDLTQGLVLSVLIIYLHSSKTAGGISLKSQFLYSLVFLTRYIGSNDYVPTWEWGNPARTFYNSFSHIVFAIIPLYILFLMMRPLRKTVDFAADTVKMRYLLSGALFAALAILCLREGLNWFTAIFYYNGHIRVSFSRMFSFVVEAIWLLPQLELTKKQCKPETITVQYLVGLQNIYRAFHLFDYFISRRGRLNGINTGIDIILTIVSLINCFRLLYRIRKFHLATPATTTALSKTVQVHLIHFFRFFQILTVSIMGYIYCYLVWNHNYHYCVSYPQNCTPAELENVKVPWAEILMITTSTLTVIECFVSNAVALQTRKIHYKALLFSTLPLLIMSSIGDFKVASSLQLDPCYWYDLSVTLRSPVETRFCMLIYEGRCMTIIALICTGQIWLISLAAVAYESAQTKASEAATRGEITDPDIKLGLV